MKKQKLSSSQGVMRCSSAQMVSPAALAQAKPNPASATLRRSNISAIAPAGSDTSISGSMLAVCTRATLSGALVRRVIAQAAPTPWISCPKLESTLADQIARYVFSRNGSRMDGRLVSAGDAAAGSPAPSAWPACPSESAIRRFLPLACFPPPGARILAGGASWRLFVVRSPAARLQGANLAMTGR